MYPFGAFSRYSDYPYGTFGQQAWSGMVRFLGFCPHCRLKVAIDMWHQ